MSSLRFQKFVGVSRVVTNTRAFEIVRQTLSHRATLRCVALRCGGKRKRPAQLVSDPVGGYVRGRSFMVWVQSPHRFGARIAARSMFTTLLHTKVAVPFDLFQDLSQALRVDPRSVTFTRTTRVERALARGLDLRSA